ncbi:MAG: tetratricopeptide repeat protein [Myxococcota bacterium]
MHRESNQIDLAIAAYAKAAQSYGEYLRRFPHDKQLYELNFFHAETLYYSLQFQQAADAYVWVRDSAADNKYLDDAAFSAVLAYEKAIEEAERSGAIAKTEIIKSSDRQPGEVITPKEIPELKRKVIEATDRYAVLNPKAEPLPNLQYRAAETLYAYEHIDEARKRFMAIMKAYPSHETARLAANWIVDSYMTEQNFSEVARFAGEFLEGDASKNNPKFRAELRKFKSGAVFKTAEKFNQEGKYDEAAAYYLKMVDEDPNSEFADLALNNAAVAYENFSRFDSASKLYERLVREHPESTYADTALFRVGLNAERFFDFDKATDSYLRLVNKYPKSDRRADAIYNAALSLENTQDYEQSAKQYLRYCNLFPGRDDAPAVCFRAGAVYEKMGDSKRVISTYQDFIKRYRKNEAHGDRVIEAYLRTAKAYEALGKKREAQKYYDLTVKGYQKSQDVKSAPYAAEGEFNRLEKQFAAFSAIEFAGSTRKQQKTLATKAKRLKAIEEDYKALLRFKQIDWTLAAFFRIGQLYQNFAESLIRAECPPEIRKAARRMGATSSEVCDEYRILLEEKAATLEDKAVERYEVAVEKGREFQVVNDWTKQTLVALNKLRRKQWPLQKEAKRFADAQAVALPPSVGDARLSLVAPPAAESVAPPEDPPMQNSKSPTTSPEKYLRRKTLRMRASETAPGVVPLPSDQVPQTTQPGGFVEPVVPDGDGEAFTEI